MIGLNQPECIPHNSAAAINHILLRTLIMTVSKKIGEGGAIRNQLLIHGILIRLPSAFARGSGDGSGAMPHRSRSQRIDRLTLIDDVLERPMVAC